MSWIKHVFYNESEGKLRKSYDRIKGKKNYIDNILTVHGLRPHTLEGHMTLYKSVLHHNGNTLPKWILEALGTYVSLLNNCEYCFEHHFAGLKTLLQDDLKAIELREAFISDKLNNVFSENELSLFSYAKALTRSCSEMPKSSIDRMKRNGFSDGEILEANQVVSYFAYANRTVLGLGVSTKGDILGLSPSASDDPTNWSHDRAKE